MTYQVYTYNIDTYPDDDRIGSLIVKATDADSACYKAAIDERLRWIRREPVVFTEPTGFIKEGGE